MPQKIVEEQTVELPSIADQSGAQFEHEKCESLKTWFADPDGDDDRAAISFTYL